MIGVSYPLNPYRLLISDPPVEHTVLSASMRIGIVDKLDDSDTIIT
jgi:hypothetical protein